MLSRRRTLGARARSDEVPSEAFTRDLFTGRLAKPTVALALLSLGIAVAYAWNAVSAPVALAAGCVVAGSVLTALVVLDRRRWGAQDVVLWQQAARERHWRAETGGPSPIQHPAQAETWLGTHPRGSVPQVYRVMAASLARDQVVRDRELAAFEPSTPAEAAWREWAIVAPRAMAAEAVDLADLRAAVEALPEGDDRRQLRATIAVAEALGRHHVREASWLEPLVEARAWMDRERLRVAQVVRLCVGRLAIVLSFVVPAVGLAASGVGAPEAFPRSYLETSIATRGDVGEIDDQALLAALPALARDIAATAPIDPTPMTLEAWSSAIDGGLPTLIWEVDAIELTTPPGAACDHVWSIEALLGVPATVGWAIVTCDQEDGPAVLVRVDPATAAELRAALGVPLLP